MKTLMTMFIASILAFSLTACDDGGAENMGESIDRGIEDVGDAIDDTGDAIEDACEDATDKNC